MEIFSALLALHAGNSPANGGFPRKETVMQTFYDSLAYTRCCINSLVDGDLRCLSPNVTSLEWTCIRKHDPADQKPGKIRCVTIYGHRCHSINANPIYDGYVEIYDWI